ncbi:MAG: hypothetical protein PHP22_03125 [Oscillospiraceae bacterium]|nr:hypothetical protein [Oscillospiraceae bacterium]
MENNKKVTGKNKKLRKPIVSSSIKRKLVIAAIILVFVISIGGFFAYSAGLPAMLLTGAEFIRTPEGGKPVVIEKIKVNELNYNFSQAVSQLQQYGMVAPGLDLDSVFDEETGKTYREYAYETACNSMKRSIQIGIEAGKDKSFKPEAVKSTVELAINNLRESVSYSGNGMTVDSYLSQMYGPGTTVSSFASFLERQLIADEYVQYLEQSVYMPTEEQMNSISEADAIKSELSTFKQYFFKAEFEEGATDEQKAAALAEARVKAEEVIARATDEKSFRDACEEFAGEDGAASFADGQDPTLAADISYGSIKGVSEEMADFVFSADRAEGDTAVFEKETGFIAVYFVSRRIDESPTIAYRFLRLDYTGEFDIEGSVLQADKDKTDLRAEELMQQVTDEKSFVSLVKKHTDDFSSKASGGLVTGVTPESLLSSDMTDESKRDLANWLISPDRKNGDRTIIKSGNYVDIVYFVENIPAWKYGLRSMMIDEQFEQWSQAIDDKGVISFEINYGNIEFATPEN